VILLQIILSLNLAHARNNGNVVGNGGNTVTCPQSVATSEIFSRQMTVLDLLEGQLLQSHSYKKLAGFRGQSLEQAFPQAVRMFLPYALWERGQFIGRFALRAQQMHFSPNDLPALSSISFYAQSLGCTIQQAAIQYGSAQPIPVEDLYLDVSAKIWNAMQTDQKIALLFHEYLLKDRLLMQGGCAVNNIREITGFILSDEAGAVSQSDWQYETNQSCMQDPQSPH
jgi:hypothetical protein